MTPGPGTSTLDEASPPEKGDPPLQSSQSYAESRRNIVWLWVAQFISKIGDQVFFFAAGMLGLSMLSDASAPAAIAVAQAFPFLIFGVFAGVIVDASNKRRLMIATDLARFALIGLVPILWIYGALLWWIVPVLAFLSYACSTLFDPARDALIPQIAGGRSLFRVNAYFQASIQAALIVGPSLLALTGFAQDGSKDKEEPVLIGLIALNALSFLVSAICVYRIRMRADDTDITIEKRKRASLRELKEGLKLVREDKRLKLLLFLTAANNFFIMGPATVGAMVMIHESLGGQVDELGMFEASMMVGFAIGFIALLRLEGRAKKGKILIWGMILDGVTYLPFGFLGPEYPFWLYLLFILLHGIFIPFIVVARTSIIQQYYKSRFHGRIFAYVALTVTGFTALSAVFCGVVLSAGVDPHALFFFAGGGGALIGCVLARVRIIRETL